MHRFLFLCSYVFLLCASFANSEDNAAAIRRARAAILNQLDCRDYIEALPHTGYSEESVKAAIAASRRIRQDIENLEKHPWAGLYYRGNRTPGAIEEYLALSPDNGFLYWEALLSSTSGPFAADVAFGPVKEEDTAIALRATVSSKSRSRSLGNRLYRVRWGDRQYLVQEKELLDFCNAVNSKKCPMYGSVYSGSWFFIRLGDESKPAPGLPEVPDKYRALLLKTPLAAQIIKIEKVTKSDHGENAFKCTVTLDVGRRDGVLPGMEFHKHDMVVHFFRVTSVSDTTCQARCLSKFPDIDCANTDCQATPHVGSKLSTVSYWGLMQEQGNREFLKSHGENEGCGD